MASDQANTVFEPFPGTRFNPYMYVRTYLPNLCYNGYIKRLILSSGAQPCYTVKCTSLHVHMYIKYNQQCIERDVISSPNAQQKMYCYCKVLSLLSMMATLPTTSVLLLMHLSVLCGQIQYLTADIHVLIRSSHSSFSGNRVNGGLLPSEHTVGVHRCTCTCTFIHVYVRTCTGLFVKL